MNVRTQTEGIIEPHYLAVAAGIVLLFVAILNPTTDSQEP